jgi:ABC-type phosphate transport system substrate-binding protein
MNNWRKNTLLIALLMTGISASGQSVNTGEKNDTPQREKVIVVTGVRFSYKLIEKWIDEYLKINPSVQIVVEARGSNDPQKYDILAEIYEHPVIIKETRAYVVVGRYAVLPVGTAKSSFARIYSQEGFTKQHIVQIFFHDIFADKEKQKTIKAPYTTYTRLQKAGVPMVFAKYFGYDQKDIKGNGIAGADTHLVNALLRDSTGVTYLPTPILYQQSGKPIEGITVIPVDLDGNGKISDNERVVNTFGQLIEKIENAESGDVKNIPIDYLHLSVDKQNASQEAIDFLKWVNENGQKDLHDFGYLLPEPKKVEKEKFNEFASKKGRR